MILYISTITDLFTAEADEIQHFFRLARLGMNNVGVESVPSAAVGLDDVLRGVGVDVGAVGLQVRDAQDVLLHGHPGTHLEQDLAI